TWSGGSMNMLDANGFPTVNCGVTLTLTQSGTSLSGTLTWTGANCSGSIPLSASSISATTHPTNVTIVTNTIRWTIGNSVFDNLLIRFTGSTDTGGTSMSGTVTLSQTTSTFTKSGNTNFRRQQCNRYNRTAHM